MFGFTLCHRQKDEDIHSMLVYSQNKAMMHLVYVHQIHCRAARSLILEGFDDRLKIKMCLKKQMLCNKIGNFDEYDNSCSGDIILESTE